MIYANAGGTHRKPRKFVPVTEVRTTLAQPQPPLQTAGIRKGGFDADREHQALRVLGGSQGRPS
jgi:hypothetical protein